MHFHMQNLAEDERDRPSDHPFWHGRAWLKFGSEWSARMPTIRLEWSHAKMGLACELRFERDEREVALHVAIPGASYWLAGTMPEALVKLLPWKLNRREYNYAGGSRSIGVRVFDDAIWIDVWNDDHETRRNDPWWMRGVIHPLDILLGPMKHTEEQLQVSSAYIPMPEALYMGKARVTLDTWKRPRWPFPSVKAKHVQLEVPNGIPVEGKGESGYDCGEDALHGISVQADSVEEAIGKFVASVYRERRKHGVPASIREAHKAAVEKVVELKEGDKL